MQTASVDVTPLFQGKKHGPNIWKKPGENFQLSSFVILEAAITRKKSVNFTGDMAWTCLKDESLEQDFITLNTAMDLLSHMFTL